MGFKRSLRCRTSLIIKLTIATPFVWTLMRLIYIRVTTPSLEYSIPRSVSAAGSLHPGHVYRRRLHASTGPTTNGATVAPHADIPRIIHQTWKTYDSIPETFRAWTASWIRVNPSWEYWFWTDVDIRALIAASYPDYLDLYDSYPSSAYRVDVFRYFVLYEYGGLYVDLDIECIRSFDDYLTSHSSPTSPDCILSQEPLEHALFLAPHGVPLVSNALMACRPRHPFFASVISGLRWYSSAVGGTSWNDVLRSTGPYMLTVSYRQYVTSSTWLSCLLGTTRCSTSGVEMSPVSLALPDDFQPSPDSSMVDFMRQKCQRADRGRRWFGRDAVAAPAEVNVADICNRLTAYDFGRRPPNTVAFSNHHWTHSWVGRRNDPWGLLNEQIKMFNIEEMFDDRLRIRPTIINQPVY